VVLGAANAEHAAGSLAVEFGDPRGFPGRILFLDVIGDDPGDECFEVRVPEHHGRLGWVFADQCRDGLHGVEQAVLVLVGEPVEQGPDLRDRALFERVLCGVTGFGQADDLAARVGTGPFPDEQSAGLKLAEQAAGVPGVQLEPAPQFGEVGDALLRDLVEYASFAE
jgi:hypothetical protein